MPRLNMRQFESEIMDNIQRVMDQLSESEQPISENTASRSGVFFSRVSSGSGSAWQPMYSGDDEDDDDSEYNQEGMSYVESYGESDEPNETPRLRMPRRSLRHNLEKIDLEKWNYEQREEALNRYFQTLEYRIKWIFNCEEREGFVRRQVAPFSLQDFRNKASKKPHPMNTESRTFYDWKLGGVDFTLRLELFEQDNYTYLRCHILDGKNDDQELCYLDKVWNGGHFSHLNHVWVETN